MYFKEEFFSDVLRNESPYCGKLAFLRSYFNTMTEEI
jgi:hypothetical protein